MSVKAVFGTFGIHGLDLKNEDELVNLHTKITNEVNKILKDVPSDRGRLSSDFEFDIEERVGEFEN